MFIAQEMRAKPICNCRLSKLLSNSSRPQVPSEYYTKTKEVKLSESRPSKNDSCRCRSENSLPGFSTPEMHQSHLKRSWSNMTRKIELITYSIHRGLLQGIDLRQVAPPHLVLHLSHLVWYSNLIYVIGPSNWRAFYSFW